MILKVLEESKKDLKGFKDKKQNQEETETHDADLENILIDTFTLIL